VNNSHSLQEVKTIFEEKLFISQDKNPAMCREILSESIKAACAYRVLVRKPEARRPLPRPTHR
jgi:hypothetical protein